MPLVPIPTIEDRRLEPYRHLKFTSDMRRAGLFIAEGEKLVRRLLPCGLPFPSLLAGERFLSNGDLARSSLDVPTFVVPDDLLREIVGFKFHRGVLACGVRPDKRRLGARSELIVKQPGQSPLA